MKSRIQDKVNGTCGSTSVALWPIAALECAGNAIGTVEEWVSAMVVGEKVTTKYLWLGVLLAVLFGMSRAALATTAFLSADQKAFLDASAALSSGAMDRYRRLKQQLAHYELLPWLEYEEARKQLKDSAEVSRFLEKYPDTVMAKRLRSAWLYSLGQRKQWQEFLQQYRDEKDVTLRCYYLDAAMRTKGMRRDLVAQAKSLWLTGKTRPDACNGAFSHLYKHKKMTSSEYWQRLALAMNRGNTSLVRFLEKKLTKTRKRWLVQWKKMKKQPEKTLQAAMQWTDKPESRDIILDGIQRYARQDVVAAWELWHRAFRNDFAFSKQQRDHAEQKMALRAAWRHLPEANEMLSQLQPGAINKEVREWRVRSALRQWDWRAAQKALAAMPESERASEQWRYWQARVDAALGKEDDAEAIYRELMQETSYYGFLAAEKLGQPYQFHQEPVVSADMYENVALLSNRPAFRRIHELDAVGRKANANREWRFETARLSNIEKRVAAQLASDWGWHFSAIVTTASAKHFSDLELRFPLLYRSEVTREARRQKLPESLIYGVIRRESAYRESVESPAGALGLMQLMPRTAKRVGKKLGIKKKLSNASIKTPEMNIRLGSRYLREVMDRYGNHVILATASYNAGPNRVKKWLPDEEPLPADIWVDTITFDETRNYVKAVLFYSTIFDWKLDNKIDYTMRERMRPVSPQPETSVVSRGSAPG